MTASDLTGDTGAQAVRLRRRKEGHMADHMTLADKVAIVTGSAGGIGAGIAGRLAAQGAKTVVPRPRPRSWRRSPQRAAWRSPCRPT